MPARLDGSPEWLSGMAIRLIYNHIEHHASHSGYDQLAKYVRAKPYQKGLIDKLADKIGANWAYQYSNPPYNDRLQEGARLDIFGYYCQVHSTALDLARFLQMILNGGVFEHQRIVSRDIVEEWTKKVGITDSDRAIGWDTKSPA